LTAVKSMDAILRLAGRRKRALFCKLKETETP